VELDYLQDSWCFVQVKSAFHFLKESTVAVGVILMILVTIFSSHVYSLTVYVIHFDGINSQKESDLPLIDYMC
jgi:hypothetical protein